jgi:hypothetical protein
MDNETEKQRDLFNGALGTEYFVLQGASSGTVSESGSRSSLYLMSLSSGMVALGFALNASSGAFIPFAAAVLPTIFVLGAFTIVRLVDTSIQNVRAAHRMARIRRFYAGLVPEGPEFFNPGETESADAEAALGVAFNRWTLWFTMASTIGIVNAVVGGSALALLFFGPLHLDGTVSIVVGVIAFVLFVATAHEYQRRRFAVEFPETHSRATKSTGAA